MLSATRDCMSWYVYIYMQVHHQSNWKVLRQRKNMESNFAAQTDLNLIIYHFGIKS